MQEDHPYSPLRLTIVIRAARYASRMPSVPGKPSVGHNCIRKIRISLTPAGGEFSHSPLRYASENGHVQVVRLLLEKGTNVNTAGFLDAALKCVWENGHEQVALLLLKKGGKYQDLELRRDTLYEMRPGAYVCIQGV